MTLIMCCPKCDGVGGIDDIICDVCGGLEVIPTKLTVNLIGNTISDLADYVANNGYPHTATREEIKKDIRIILTKEKL